MTSYVADQDRLARLLALGAGVDWDRLGDYPGYSKSYWREQAQAMRAMIADETAPAARRAAR